LALGWLNPLLETGEQVVATLGVPLVGAIPRVAFAGAMV
jgi:hypothetical protein